MSLRKQDEADPLPDHMARWASGLARRMEADLAGLAPADWAQVRGSQRMLLSLISKDGSRVTDLAAMARMTKQSLGEAVDLLEAAGLVSSGRDPSDGRVRLVRRTEAGDGVLAQTQRMFDELEDGWRAQVGSGRYEVMKQVIRELAADQF